MAPATSGSSISLADLNETSNASLAPSAAEILNQKMPWETYMTARLISHQDLQLIRRYDKHSADEQAALLEEDGAAYAQTFLTLVRNITKNDVVQYALALIDDMLSADEGRAALFHVNVELDSESSVDPYTPLLKLLQKDDWFTQEAASRVLVRVIAARPGRGSEVLTIEDDTARVDGTGASSSSETAFEVAPGLLGQVVSTYVDWLCNQLRRPTHPSRSAREAVCALAILLRERSIRPLFLRAGGVQLLVPLLTPSASPSTIQMLYEATFCVWNMSFLRPAAELMGGAGVLPALVEVARVVSKEKVVRMAVLTLKNLAETTGMSYGADAAELGFLKVVSTLQQGTWADEELVDALSNLGDGLQQCLKDASSFDKYRKEVGVRPEL
ncbi:hypothetical protein CYMTET_21603 [Cymbomonas tetramitiformis]|uniref:Uncharacterized protein n=1 Tax=Cymbomonas tetramitiformis TaxID=36881 RepID=A0AAE0G310_9CHLO|nr:hypothetical protein CYMTET_21603 [Cymbomonas tetramitiformis]